MTYAKWADVAESLMRVYHWRTGDYPNGDEAVRRLAHENLQTILLADIAKSLRVLRCQNFQNIPFKLDAIKRSVARIPRRKVKK